MAKSRYNSEEEARECLSNEIDILEDIIRSSSAATDLHWDRLNSKYDRMEEEHRVTRRRIIRGITGAGVTTPN